MDILNILNTTATTITAQLTDGERFLAGLTISLYDNTKTTVLQTADTDENGEVVFSGLSPETLYYVYYQTAGYEDALTTADSAKTALESQWSDLAGKVKKAQAGSIKTLTTADYNYPVDNPSAISFIDLKEGYYVIGEDLQIAGLSTSSFFNFRQGDIFIKLTPIGATYPKCLYTRRGTDANSGEITFWVNGNRAGHLLDNMEVVDGLTSNLIRSPLSANQGKVLNEKIEGRIINGGTTAPTTSTVGSVGTLYSYVDTTGTTPEPHLLTCTAVDTTVPSTPVYTWTDLLGSVAQALNIINNGSSN